MKLNIPIGFTFKPVVKQKKESTGPKSISKTLYCLSVKDENGIWKAHVNTKGIDNYPNTFICDFTPDSHKLEGKINVFSHKKNKNGLYTRYIRSYAESLISPGNEVDYSPFCENNIYSGTLVKLDGVIMFNIKDFVGSKFENEKLLLQTNIIKKDEK